MSTPLTVDFGEERTRFKKKTRFLDGVTPRSKNEGVVNVREIAVLRIPNMLVPLPNSNGNMLKMTKNENRMVCIV